MPAVSFPSACLDGVEEIPCRGRRGFTLWGWSHGRFGRWEARAELGWGMASCRVIHQWKGRCNKIAFLWQ